MGHTVGLDAVDVNDEVLDKLSQWQSFEVVKLPKPHRRNRLQPWKQSSRGISVGDSISSLQL